MDERGVIIDETHRHVVAGELNQAFGDFYNRAINYRSWVLGDLPTGEMSQRGQMLSDETVRLLAGLCELKTMSTDFPREGLEIVRKDRTLRNLLIHVGWEDSIHAIALGTVLTSSELRSQEDIDLFVAHPWNLSSHRGLDNPLGILIYYGRHRMETAHYAQELHRRVRREYGSEEITEEENKRGYQFGAADALHKIALDDLDQFYFSLKLIKIYLEHFPYETLGKIKEVLNNFEMPGPGRLFAVSHLPFLQALGLENDVLPASS